MVDDKTVAAIRQAIDRSPVVAKIQRELRLKEEIIATLAGMSEQYATWRSVVKAREAMHRAQEKK